MEERVSTLRRALAAERIPLDVRCGGEISLELAAGLEPAARRRFGLAGNPRYLLLELPSFGWPLELPTRLFRLLAAGVTPVLAHPERNV
jgi:protein-tyrosine phosphatase